jgi:hypothetical protein
MEGENMKLDLTVSITDENLENVEEKIVKEAAKQLVNEVFSNRYEHYGSTFRDKVKEEVKDLMLEIFNTKFKNEVKNNVVDELTKKYIRTKQYKEVKEQFNILSDTEIKTGLKGIISELVNIEIKNKFK